MEKDYGISINYALTTNGSLATNEIANMLMKFNVSTTVSIDGLESSNNKIRVKKDKSDTFESIKKGIDILKKHNAIHVFSAVITKENFYDFDEKFIDFARKV